MKAVHGFLLLCGLCASAWAQSLDEREQAITKERAELAQQRQELQQEHDRAAKACWQRFAVNDCLAQARQARRVRTEPLRQRELELNALSRALREERRQLRLQDTAEPASKPGAGS
jgi:hypothetical protein